MARLCSLCKSRIDELENNVHNIESVRWLTIKRSNEALWVGNYRPTPPPNPRLRPCRPFQSLVFHKRRAALVGPYKAEASTLLLHRLGTGNSSRLNGRMLLSSRFLRIPSAPSLLMLLAALLAGPTAISSPAAAQGTHLWQQSHMEEFEKGTPAGVSVESDGHLRQGPGLTELVTTPSTFVWSLAAEPASKGGELFVGTGSPAMVLRLVIRAGEKR